MNNTTLPDPGEGYDLITLENCEQFEPKIPTDEYYDPCSDTWKPVGESCVFCDDCVYRRRKTTPETKAITGVKYQRVVGINGNIQYGDRIRFIGSNSMGKPIDRPEYYREDLGYWNTDNTEVWRQVPQGQNSQVINNSKREHLASVEKLYNLIQATLLERDQLRSELAATKKELENYKAAADSYARQIREMNGVKG